MKKTIKTAVFSALTLFSLTGVIGITNVKADYIHTFEQTNIFAKGSVSEFVPDPASYLYNFSLVTDRALASGSDWYTDQGAISADGSSMWRVATNEWVGSQNIAYVHTTDLGAFSTSSSKEIYNLDKKDFSFSDTGKVLPAGEWMGGQAVYLNNSDTFVLYRQVASNEWIKSVFKNGVEL